MSTTSRSIESGHADVIHDVQMDYYGKRVASCSSDRIIKIFAVAGDQQSHIADLSGHEGPVWQVAWAHPKFGSLLASCSYDRKIILWKEGGDGSWVQAHTFSHHSASVNSLSFSPHEFGLRLAAASSDGSVSLMSLSPHDGTWDVVFLPQAHPVGVTGVSWSPPTPPSSLLSGASSTPPSLPRFASCGCDNTVKVWKLEGGAGGGDSSGGWVLEGTLSKHSDWVRDVAWAPNLGLPKSTIASASQDGTVLIWTQGGEGQPWSPSLLHDFRVPVWRLSWSLTGNFLAVSDANNAVSLWKEALDGQWVQISTIGQQQQQ